MTALRQLNPISSSAAILLNHTLAFNIPGGMGEPSWASIEPLPVTDNDDGSRESSSSRSILRTDLSNLANSVVHGVLYQLTEEDFTSVCQSEGVPFAYTLHRCHVILYAGNGKNAGETAVQKACVDMNYDEDNSSPTRQIGIPAFTLRATNKIYRKKALERIPPSLAYKNILIRGAKEFKLDESYVQMLEELPYKGNGYADRMLRLAEVSQSIRQLFPF